MADIYTDTDFTQRVCTLISADENIFTAEMVESFEFKGLAEISVKKAVPLWNDILDGEDTAKADILKACVVFQTGLYLAPNVRKEQIKVQQTTHAKVEFFENSAYDMLTEGLAERLAYMEMELNGEDFNGFSAVALTNEDKRYYGSGFDAE
jgi:hypothetical protein